MQTVIKSQYDAGAPGDLVVLPSFNSAAKVESCRAGAAIYPGDAVKLVDGADSSVVPLESTDDVTVAYGVAISAHSNMPAMPTFGSNDTAFGVSANVPQGIVTNGPVCVAVASGETPKKGLLATPTGRNDISGFMEWGVLATGQSLFRFDSPVLQGGVAHIIVVEGALLGKAEAPVISVTGAEVTPESASIAEGGTQQLTATVTPEDATDKTGAWESSDETIATVDEDGLVTAVSGGDATITFTTTDGGKTATSDITVTVDVASVTVAPATASLAPGATQQLTPTVSPANATDKKGTWSSDDETIATVSATGLVTVKSTAAAASTASITFTTTDGGKTASCAVTVSGS
jgi:hypothetical protein